MRVVRADGTGGRDVVTTPGSYTEPAFSPDGKTIVFRNAGADFTRGPLYDGTPGIYVVPADGSGAAAARARRRHRAVSSITTGKRVYVNDFATTRPCC